MKNILIGYLIFRWMYMSSLILSTFAPNVFVEKINLKKQMLILLIIAMNIKTALQSQKASSAYL